MARGAGAGFRHTGPRFASYLPPVAEDSDDEQLFERLEQAIYEAGMAVEQVGADAISAELADDGRIVLHLDTEERIVAGEDDALAVIAEWAEDAGRQWHPGAIVAFSEALSEIVAAWEGDLTDGEFWDRHDELVEQYGLDSYGPEPTGMTAEGARDIIGFYGDPNDCVWCVDFDGADNVDYVPASVEE